MKVFLRRAKFRRKRGVNKRNSLRNKATTGTRKSNNPSKTMIESLSQDLIREGLGNQINSYMTSDIDVFI